MDNRIVKEKGIPCCSLRHRHHGPLVYVDLKIEVEKDMTAEQMSQVCLDGKVDNLDGKECKINFCRRLS